MNFEDFAKKIIENFWNDERDCIYYILKGNIFLYVNEKEKEWTKIFLKGAVREKSVYIFDIFLTIEKIDEYTYELKAGRVVRKNYFNLGNTSNDKIPLKYEKDKFGSIETYIYYFQEKNDL